jgi:thioredoxin-related protein
MKRFILIIIILTASLSVNAQVADKKVRWYTLMEALELNKKAPKKIIIDIYTDWCGWCKKMDKETFEHPVISDYLNKNFYPVKFNAESKDSIVFAGYKFGNPGLGSRSTHQFAMALFQAQKTNPGYPAIAYINENLQLIGVMPGYLSASQIEPILNFITEDKYKTVSLDEYQKTFVTKIKQ